LAIAWYDSWHANHAYHSSDDEAVGPTPEDTSGEDSDDKDLIPRIKEQNEGSDQKKRKASTSIDKDAACAAESPSSKKRTKKTPESIQGSLAELEAQLEDLNEYQTLADVFTARDLIARLANPHEGSELDYKGLTAAFQALKKPWADAKRINALKKQIAGLKGKQERLLKRKAKQEATAEERAAKRQRTKKEKEAKDVILAFEMLQLRAGYMNITKKATMTPEEKAYMVRMMTTNSEPVNGHPPEEHFKRNNPNVRNPLTALKPNQDDSNESDWESTDDEAN